VFSINLVLYLTSDGASCLKLPQTWVHENQTYRMPFRSAVHPSLAGNPWVLHSQEKLDWRCNFSLSWRA